MLIEANAYRFTANSDDISGDVTDDVRRRGVGEERDGERWFIGDF
jgi:hypothetical protein